MTESELRLEQLAASIGRARQRAGCAVLPESGQREEIPVMGGEARHRDCLVSMLASGSKGNAAFIRCGRTKILIDAGIKLPPYRKWIKNVRMLPV